MKYLIAAAMLSGVLTAQAAKTTNIGGGCSPAKGSLMSVGKAITGKTFTVKYGFPEPVGADAWAIMGIRDPNTAIFSCTLHAFPNVVIRIGTGGEMKIPVPNAKTFVGLVFYLQALWAAPTFKPALTDGYKVKVGSQ